LLNVLVLMIVNYVILICSYPNKFIFEISCNESNSYQPADEFEILKLDKVWDSDSEESEQYYCYWLNLFEIEFAL